VPAFAAAIVLTLVAGWSNDPDLDQPGAQPGYGPNHPGYPPLYDPVDYQRPSPPEAAHGIPGQYGEGPVAIGGGDHVDPEPGAADPYRPR
jgi:hypothetical protein